MIKIKLFLSFVLIFIFVGIASAQEFESKSGNILNSAGNRYVFGQVSKARRDIFMLDTETGRLWKFKVDENNDPLLEPVPYRLLDGTYRLNAPTPKEDIEALNRKRNMIEESDVIDDLEK